MYQQRNGKQLMMIGGGVIILVLLGAMFLSSRGGSSKNAAGPKLTPVVVALQAIPQGTTFAAGQPIGQFFAVRQVPDSIVPFGSYRSVNQITGLIASAGCTPRRTPGCRGTVTVLQTMYQNMPVVSGMFSTLGQFRQTAGPAFQIPYGYVAIGVGFTAVNSVLGSINAGDDVDIMASLANPETSTLKLPKQTQFALNDVRVIGVGGPPAAPDSSGGSSSSSTTSSAATNPNTPGAGGTLLLLVRYQQALVIQHLKDFGGTWTMSAVLRSSKENDIPHFHTTPVTGRWFFVKQSNRFDFTNPY